jgi:superfamily II DNA/RNA helicase
MSNPDPPHPPNFPWYAIYTEAVDAVYLTLIILRHAELVTAAAVAARAVLAAERQRQVLCFDLVEMDEDDDNNSTASDVSVDLSSPFIDHLNSGASRVFAVESLRPKQVEGVERIIFDPSSGGRLIIVDRTGGGKSLILAMTAICIGGITLVLVPLLALTANQLARLSKAIQKYGVVSAFHMDEISRKDLNDKIIPMMDTMRYDSSSTRLLLCSPQYLADTPAFLAAVLRANSRRLLRLVAVDEAHLIAMHGRTFRDAIRVLADDFFSVVFSQNAQYSPLFLAMTATMSDSLLRSFKDLTSVDWTKPCHQLWSSAKEFQQRNIEMDLKVTGNVSEFGLPDVVKLLKTDDHAHVCIFVNFKSETSNWGGKLEALLAAELLRVGVVQINGDMDKHEKFAFIRLFCTDITIAGYNPRTLVATTAANTGIDQARLLWVLRVGIPRCIVTLLQERDRNARLLGQLGMIVVFIDWHLFVKLLISILLPPAKPTSHEHDDVDYVNTMIESQSPEKRATRPTVTPSTTRKRPLTRAQRRDNIINSYNDYIDSINFLFMPGWGCLHLRSEWLLSTKHNTRPPQSFKDEHGPCNDMCYVCKCTHRKWMLPIVFEGAVEFLGTELFKGQMPYVITHDDSEGLPNILWESNDMRL